MMSDEYDDMGRQLVDQFEGLVGSQVCRLRADTTVPFPPIPRYNSPYRQDPYFGQYGQSAHMPHPGYGTTNQWNCNAMSAGDNHPLRGLGTMTQHLRPLLCTMVNMLEESNNNQASMSHCQAIRHNQRKKHILHVARKKAACFENQLLKFVNPKLVTSLNRRSAKAACETEKIGKMISKLRKLAKKSDSTTQHHCQEMIHKVKSMILRQKNEWQCVGRLKETMAIADEMKSILKFISHLTFLLDQTNQQSRRLPERPPSYEITCGLTDDSMMTHNSNMAAQPSFRFLSCLASPPNMMSSISPCLSNIQPLGSQSEMTISVSMDIDDDEFDDDYDDDDYSPRHARSRRGRRKGRRRPPSSRTESLDRSRRRRRPTCTISVADGKRSRSDSRASGRSGKSIKVTGIKLKQSPPKSTCSIACERIGKSASPKRCDKYPNGSPCSAERSKSKSPKCHKRQVIISAECDTSKNDKSTASHFKSAAESFYTASRHSGKVRESLSGIIERCVSECLQRTQFANSLCTTSPPKSKPKKRLHSKSLSAKKSSSSRSRSKSSSPAKSCRHKRKSPNSSCKSKQRSASPRKTCKHGKKSPSKHGKKSPCKHKRHHSSSPAICTKCDKIADGRQHSESVELLLDNKRSLSDIEEVEHSQTSSEEKNKTKSCKSTDTCICKPIMHSSPNCGKKKCSKHKSPVFKCPKKSSRSNKCRRKHHTSYKKLCCCCKKIKPSNSGIHVPSSCESLRPLIMSSREVQSCFRDQDCGDVDNGASPSGCTLQIMSPSCVRTKDSNVHGSPISLRVGGDVSRMTVCVDQPSSSEETSSESKESDVPTATHEDKSVMTEEIFDYKPTLSRMSVGSPPRSSLKSPPLKSSLKKSGSTPCWAQGHYDDMADDYDNRSYTIEESEGGDKDEEIIERKTTRRTESVLEDNTTEIEEEIYTRKSTIKKKCDGDDIRMSSPDSYLHVYRESRRPTSSLRNENEPLRERFENDGERSPRSTLRRGGCRSAVSISDHRPRSQASTLSRQTSIKSEIPPEHEGEEECYSRVSWKSRASVKQENEFPDGDYEDEKIDVKERYPQSPGESRRSSLKKGSVCPLEDKLSRVSAGSRKASLKQEIEDALFEEDRRSRLSTGSRSPRSTIRKESESGQSRLSERFDDVEEERRSRYSSRSPKTSLARVNEGFEEEEKERQSRSSERSHRSTLRKESYRQTEEVEEEDEEERRSRYSEKSPRSSSRKESYRQTEHIEEEDEEDRRSRYSEKSPRSSSRKESYRETQQTEEEDREEMRSRNSEKSPRSSSRKQSYRETQQTEEEDREERRSRNSEKSPRSSSRKESYRETQQTEKEDKEERPSRYSEKSPRSSQRKESERQSLKGSVEDKETNRTPRSSVIRRESERKTEVTTVDQDGRVSRHSTESRKSSSKPSKQPEVEDMDLQRKSTLRGESDHEESKRSHLSTGSWKSSLKSDRRESEKSSGKPGSATGLESTSEDDVLENSPSRQSSRKETHPEVLPRSTRSSGIRKSTGEPGSLSVSTKRSSVIERESTERESLRSSLDTYPSETDTEFGDEWELKTKRSTKSTLRNKDSQASPLPKESAMKASEQSPSRSSRSYATEKPSEVRIPSKVLKKSTIVTDIEKKTTIKRSSSPNRGVSRQSRAEKESADDTVADDYLDAEESEEVEVRKTVEANAKNEVNKSDESLTNKELFETWWKFVLMSIVGLYLLYLVLCALFSPPCEGCTSGFPNVLGKFVTSARRSLRLVHYSQATV